MLGELNIQLLTFLFILLLPLSDMLLIVGKETSALLRSLIIGLYCNFPAYN